MGDWTADEVLEQETHSSVTRKRLEGTNRNLLLRPFQRLGWVRGWLSNTPYYEYLDDDEVPKFLFRMTKPIEFSSGGEPEKVSPDKQYSALAGLTPSRLLIVIGQKPTNEVYSRRFDDITSFDIRPQTDLEVRYAPKPKDAIDEPREPKGRLSLAVESSKDRVEFYPDESYTPSTVINKFGKFLAGKTGIDDWGSKNEWLDAHSKYQRHRKRYDEREGTVMRLVDEAKHDSIAESTIRRYLDLLEEEEQPHFYTSGSVHGHEIRNPSETGPSEIFDHRFTIFTDQRVLIEDRSDSWSLPNQSIQAFEISQRTRQEDDETPNETVSGDKKVPQVEIETSQQRHHFDVDTLSQNDLSELLRHLQHVTD